MKNKIIIPTILFIVIFIFSFFALSQEKNKIKTETSESINQKSQQASEMILFYGDGCPHCAIVEQYIKQNNISNKISFVQKEVYYNQLNLKELEAKAKICGLPTNSIGVPFFWDGEKCLIGDQDIINFFKAKTSNQ